MTPGIIECGGTVASLRLLRANAEPSTRRQECRRSCSLLAEEVSDVRAFRGAGLVGDRFFGAEGPLAGLVLFAGMEDWRALARRLPGPVPNAIFPRHVLTEGVDWAQLGSGLFQLGEAIFRPVEGERAARIKAKLDAQLGLPVGELPGVVATVEETGWLRSDQPVFCGCGR